jgi:uncharacterized protein YhbP (UPF0306 family)
MYNALSGGYSKDDFKKFIEARKVAVLATTSPNWGVQATAVFYAVEGEFSLLVKSHRTSDHGKEMQINPHIVLTIYDHNSTYTVKSGVQLRAICERIIDKIEMQNAVEIYSKTFPGANQRFAPIDELVSPDVKSTLFRMKIVSGKMLTPDGYSSDFQEF